MQYFFYLIVFFLAFSTTVYAESVQNKSKTTKSETTQTQEKMPEKDGEEAVDASKHLVQAPEMDPELVRDPFISFFDKKRQQQQQQAREDAARQAANSEAVDPNVINYKMKHSIRPHDPLEAFDLGTLKLVAILAMGQERIAMIENSTKVGFMVRVGEYMGTNNGRIIHITSDTIIILEEVLSPADELIVEEAILKLHPDG